MWVPLGSVASEKGEPGWRFVLDNFKDRRDALFVRDLCRGSGIIDRIERAKPQMSTINKFDKGNWDRFVGYLEGSN